ncbi:N-acetylmuramoyl-L-alanine amidase [Streptomyces sp. SID8361]|uniref:peptidoglycan-binding protein n=1 Tax=Streptomyces sp. MnatMP-M27 TaxID=1839768 RepID=UPI00081D8A17|nr:N-acetylmuramoyl-L-alanine amidase [Streptomyces sp. SID8361]SCF82327.1 phage r1t holin [Streptomyces sp. MnatMP-M27]
MATPLSADRFLSVLKGAGLGVVEHGKWRTHNRNTHGNWGPANGVMIHHTGPYTSEKEMVELCRTGYQDLPGPLCHGVIDRSGTVHLVGYGRCNHAGMGDTDVLLAVIAEKKTLPRDNEADTDGNRHFYGFECISTGSHPWPAAQLDAMARAAAAICRAHGWNEHSVIGHKEWRPGKPDPGGIDMDEFRARVARHLKDGGRPKPDPKPRPRPKPGPTPKYAAYPGKQFFRNGRSSPVIAAMAKRLIAEGCDSYETPPGRVWNDAHRRSYAAYQIKRGHHGVDADGIPGPETWADLRVPYQAGAPQPNPTTPDQEHDPMPQALADIAERTVATYLQSLLGLMAASSTTDMVSLSAWQAAAVSAIPAALSALKSTLGTALGRPGTASWLPVKRDPATPKH